MGRQCFIPGQATVGLFEPQGLDVARVLRGGGVAVVARGGAGPRASQKRDEGVRSEHACEASLCVSLQRFRRRRAAVRHLSRRDARPTLEKRKHKAGGTCINTTTTLFIKMLVSGAAENAATHNTEITKCGTVGMQ